MSSQIPDQMLRHLEYLRNLHLESPRIGNVYLEDTALREYTQIKIGKNEEFQKQLIRLGEKFATIYLENANDAESNQPKLEQFDGYGRRIDKIHLSEGWKNIAKLSAQDGIVQLSYEEDVYKLKHLQRYGQLVALYMYQPSSGLYGCPLAMTDGAAFIIKDLIQKVNTRKGYLDEAYNHLTSRKQSWTSGQWMTQKKGGSDVSNTQTLAIQQSKDRYKLYGYKWFTSATDSQMALGLAKVIPKGAQPTQQTLSTLKVSLFYIKMRKQNGQLNNLQIIRLKDKLGTKQLPTAELLLKGTEAYLISPQGQGVKAISKMLTITRIYNSASSVAAMRRILSLGRDYSRRRSIGKNKLSDLPLQLRVFSHLEVTHRANLILYLHISELFSKLQNKVITDDQSNVLRVMTPLMKLFTAKQAVEVCSEGLEAFGGMGYIQNSHLPQSLRDTQVLTIWQGTTNVLCYDFVRALLKKQNSITPFESLIRFFVKIFEDLNTHEVKNNKFQRTTQIIILSYNYLISDLSSAIKSKFTAFKSNLMNTNLPQHFNPFSQLRNLCFGTTRIYIALLLQNHVLHTYRDKDIEISFRWASRGLYHRQTFDYQNDRMLALDINTNGKQKGIGDVDERGKIRPRF